MNATAVTMVLLVVGGGIFLAQWNSSLDRPCPACRKRVPIAADVCSHCGRDLPLHVPGPAKDGTTPLRLLGILGIAVGVVAALFAVLFAIYA